MSVDELRMHQRLSVELADRLTEPALRCEEGEVRDLDRNLVVRISDYDVATAARCQAKAAALPTDFEPNIFTTSRAVALRSMRWLRRHGSVIDAVGHTMRHARGAVEQAAEPVDAQTARQPSDNDGSGPERDWLGEYLSDPIAAPIDVRVRIAARATTWLTTALDVLEVDDPQQTRGWRYDIRPRWRYPGRGLALDGRVDLALPVAGNHTPVLVLSTLHPAMLDQAAYNICLWTINQRKPPEEVLVVELPTAAIHRLATNELFERGIEAAARAAHSVTSRTPGATEPDVDLKRTPSGFTCSGCSWASGCEDKVAFEQQPARRGGIQLTPSPRGLL